MSDRLIALLVSLAVTFVAAPLVRAGMLRGGILDVPNHRSSHTAPVPRGGGVACLAGVLASLLVAQFLGWDVPWALTGGVVALALVGLMDDRAGLRALPRLAAQVAIGAVMGLALGGGWWIALGMAVTAVSVNVSNFMDGINGISSLTMSLWGITALFLGATQGVPALAVLGGATVGAALGFLPWNAPVAKLFLGDVGSYLFGGLVAAGVLLGARGGASMPVLLSPLSIYLADTSATLIRRAVRGDSLLSAHREHVYQRLVVSGRMSHLAAASTATAAALLVVLGWLLLPGAWAATLTAVVTLGFLSLPRLLRLPRESQPASVSAMGPR